ncbi:hypothetical protein EVA_02937, partial [gut metagenome]
SESKDCPSRQSFLLAKKTAGYPVEATLAHVNDQFVPLLQGSLFG